MTKPAKVEKKFDDNQLIFYTDTIKIVKSNYGLIFDFIQPLANEERIITSVGMSEKFAKKFLKTLEKTLKEKL